MTSNPARTAAGDDALVGGDVLQLITAGMHSDPLTIYREYLQNAADAAVASEDAGRAVRVDIWLDLPNGRVTIRDDGPGLSHGEIRRSLLAIGRSRKAFGATLGFRGVGRLAALAFARSVTFSTRRQEGAAVTSVRWDGDALRATRHGGETAQHVIEKSVTIAREMDREMPPNFFEVRIDGISRAASSVILNRDRVSAFVSQVCSVPFANDFPFSGSLDCEILGRVPHCRLAVYLDGASEPLRRPHGGALPARSQRSDSYVEFERIQIPRLDGASSEDPMAIGWIAHTSYLGALPGAGQVRGIRARIRDFQMGGERVFEHLFSEPRFNQWCVAEIHILDSRIRPNGRRDYFEPSPYLRHLENQMGGVCRRLERRCRVESRNRNARRRVENVIAGVEEACELVRLGYLTEEANAALIAGQRREIERARQNIELFNGTDFSRQIAEKEKVLDALQKAVPEGEWDGMERAEQAAYRRVFSAISAVSASPRQARQTIEAVLKASGRTGSAGHSSSGDHLREPR